jgi:hypothetical protein
MGNLELIPHLQAALAEVLETMFFTSIVDSEDGPGVPAGAPMLFSRLNFSGVPSGVFEIGIAPDAARALATAFFGEEDQEITEARTGEVVCELANILCGSVLSRIARGAIFELSRPEIAAGQMEAPAVRLGFELPEGRAASAIRFEEPL